MKAYKEIKSIFMADDNDVEYVEFEPLDPDFMESLKGYYKGDIEQASRETRTPLTKAQVLEMSGHAPVRGYGKHSGRKLWQLPQRIVRQVRKSLKAVEIS